MLYVIVGGLMMMAGVGGIETDMGPTFPWYQFGLALVGGVIALHGAVEINNEDENNYE